MNSDQLFKIVEKYSRQIDADFEGLAVIRIPDRKTVYIEQIDGMGRAIMMTEYKVNGFIYWAGYSSRSQTVFISLAA